MVKRPRLIQRLNKGLQGRLTLISAPAGSGKTTLISEWLRQSNIPAIWLSLDANDNDPSRLFTYVVTALQDIEPHIGQTAQEILQSPQPPTPETLLTSIINDIALIQWEFIFVLDDYHLIENTVIHEACTFLIDHLPPGMHIVISSREDPPLPLNRLRARRQMIEIRAADLRLTETETITFLNEAMRLHLSPAEAVALANRTEGWIAGLHLVALSLQGRHDRDSFINTFTGNDRYIADYLVGEVLIQQPADVQQFLLQTAILNRFCGALCDTVIEQNNRDSQSILEYLEQTNLFIVPLDHKREWYRYHHLFADLLRHRLNRLEANHIPTLHQRAAYWYEQHVFFDEALYHLLQAGDIPQAARLIEQYGTTTLWVYGQMRTVISWLQQFPAKQLHHYPQLCMLYAWMMYIAGSYDSIEPYVRTVETCLQTHTTTYPITTDVNSQFQIEYDQTSLHIMMSEITLLRAFVAGLRGEIAATQTAFVHAQHIYTSLSEQEHYQHQLFVAAIAEASYLMGEATTANNYFQRAIDSARFNKHSFLELVCMTRLLDIHLIQGHLHQATQLCEQMRSLVSEPHQQHLLTGVWVDITLSRILYEWNDLKTAADLLQRGIERSRQAALSRIVVECLITLARVLRAQGNGLEAWQATQEALQMTHYSFISQDWGRLSSTAYQVHISLAEGNIAAAVRWMQDQGLSETDTITYYRELDYLTLARILIAQERGDAALTLLEQLQVAAETGGRYGRVIEALALKALALQGCNQMAEACATLSRALSLAEPQGYIRLFVDEGRPMAQLLSHAAAEGIAPDYVGKLLANFPTNRDHQDKSLLVEPLSDREIEVIRLIAAGLSNQEIAQHLTLSLGTVKAHIRHIYAKLDVKSRTQAIDKAKALGILT